MLIDHDLLRFCAARTNEVEARYDETCIRPGDEDGFRSVDDLDWIMQGFHGVIEHRQLRFSSQQAKVRSVYMPEEGLIACYYVNDLTEQQHRYYKTKELMQVHLWQESLNTQDVVDLVQNMILRASPASVDLSLGHATTSEF